MTDDLDSITVQHRFGYRPDWGLPPLDQRDEVAELMEATQEPDHSGRTTRRVGTDPTPADGTP